MATVLRNYEITHGHAYLVTRHTRQAARRGDPRPVARTAIPWDDRLWPTPQETWSTAVFRAKLWAHALPTRELRGRGDTVAAARACTLCTNETPQTQWHVIARCDHAALVATRLKAKQDTLKVLGEALGTLAPPALMAMEWRAALVATHGPTEADAACVLYGQLPPEWLSNWGTAKGVSDQRIWVAGTRALGRVAASLLQGSHDIWKCYNKLTHPKATTEPAAAEVVQETVPQAAKPATTQQLALFKQICRLAVPVGSSTWTAMEVGAWARAREKAAAQTRKKLYTTKLAPGHTQKGRVRVRKPRNGRHAAARRDGAPGGGGGSGSCQREAAAVIPAARRQVTLLDLWGVRPPAAAREGVG
jgi:hypothetical protein